eukprot:763795-Hanusia_phi.AAC.2
MQINWGGGRRGGVVGKKLKQVTVEGQSRHMITERVGSLRNTRGGVRGYSSRVRGPFQASRGWGTPGKGWAVRWCDQ